MVRHHIHSEVVEDREHQRTDDRDAVFEVRRKAGVATDGRHAINRQRHLDALVVLRIGGIARNATAIRIGELEVDSAWNVAVRRSRANVKAAQFVLAAGVEAVLRWSHSAAKALHVTELRADAQHVVPVL